jgi:hypothetical protein
MTPAQLMGESVGFGLAFAGIAYFFLWIYGEKKKKNILVLVFFLSFAINLIIKIYSTTEKSPEATEYTPKHIDSKVEEFHLKFDDPNFDKRSNR